MQLENVFVVAKREYLQRARSKAFWVTTLILPLFVAAVSVVPSILIAKSKTQQKIVVVDETGKVGTDLVAKMNAQQAPPPADKTGTDKAGDDTKGNDRDQNVTFAASMEPLAPNRAAQRAALDRQVLAKTIDAWVWIGHEVFQDKPVEYHARSISNIFTQAVLKENLTSAVRQVRLHEAGIDPARVEQLSRPVKLDEQQVAAKGKAHGGGLSTAFLAVGLFLILYVSILVWGQQVMQGVLEEKGSRVIEVLVSCITPFELLLGKLIGICLLGLTQLSIWLGTMLVLTTPAIVAAVSFLPKKAALPSLAPSMLINFILLFILGFLAYATLYAAIGASFNNVQEAQQASSIAMVFVIIPVMVMWPVVNDPNSTMATVLSLIPMFTPLLMPLRIALDMPPAWQIALAYVLTIGFVIGMVWLCARIYRVGILMYGKKPTFQEIWKWTKYA